MSTHTDEASRDKQSAVALDTVTVRFGTQVVHSEISLTVGKGEVLTLLGPSGTGKTVLLKLMIGLLKPSSGTVHVLGQDITSLNDRALAPIREKVGMLFQGAALFDSISVFENVAYGLRERGQKSEDEIEATVLSQLSFVGLHHAREKLPSELSGGQKKRIGLARALATSPEILLYDEPTTGLDPTSIRRIDELILRLRDEQGVTSIVVTHDIESAKRVSDRWILLSGGQILADGAPSTLLESSAEVQQFVEGQWQE